MAPQDQAAMEASAVAEQQENVITPNLGGKKREQGWEELEPSSEGDRVEEEGAVAAQDGSGSYSATDLELGESGRKAWKDEAHLIPKNNLILVFGGLILSTFLVSLDQTIVSSSLPTIARELNASSQGLSWVGSAYLRKPIGASKPSPSSADPPFRSNVDLPLSPLRKTLVYRRKKGDFVPLHRHLPPGISIVRRREEYALALHRPRRTGSWWW